MARTGRNDPCPCGSGKKFKKCCLDQIQTSAQPIPEELREKPLSLAIRKIQESAAAGEKAVNILGVFVFFATVEGDAWLIEITEMDGLQVAKAGKPLEFEMQENTETIEINYSHKIRVADNLFSAKPYQDKGQEWESFPAYPAHSIGKALNKARKKFPSHLLQQVHVS